MIVKRRVTGAAVVCTVLVAVAVWAYYRPTLERVRTGWPRVRVAAAADLRFALNDIIRRFEDGRRVDVSVSYGSSGTMYAQLVNEAPFDLFLSADIEYPRRLAAGHLTLPDSEFTYAVGRLVVWVPASSRLDVGRHGLVSVADATVQHVAIANPAHAPYGRAAIEAMRTAGVYDAAKPKLVFGENVEQALQYAQSGAADVGIVALSLALAPPVKAQGRYIVVPLEAYPRITQGGVILRWAADVDAARALRAFLIGPAGKAILQQYGFFMPEDLQPVAKVQLHSAGDASPLTALLLPQIFPIFSVVAPCHRGASPASVRRRTFTTGC
jgi:molybdate transport system substrate-binding protein